MVIRDEWLMSFDFAIVIHFIIIHFIKFKDSPTGKNPDRGGLHREAVRK